MWPGGGCDDAGGGRYGDYVGGDDDDADDADDETDDDDDGDVDDADDDDHDGDGGEHLVADNIGSLGAW